MLPPQQSADKGPSSDNPTGSLSSTGEQVKAAADCLRVFLRPGQLAELRAPKAAGGVAGCFEYDQLDLMARHAVDLSGKAEAVYFTINPIRRAADIPGIKRIGLNKLGPCRKGEHTQDAHIERRLWIPIDIDPVRVNAPRRSSSTDAEREAARKVLDRCLGVLQADGFRGLVLGDSGNGWHVCVPVDLPNDEQSRELVRRLLKGLNDRCGDEFAQVDATTFNAARIWKVYHTWARKGDNTPGHPHRRSRLLDEATSEPWNEENARHNSDRLRRLLDTWGREDELRKAVEPFRKEGAKKGAPKRATKGSRASPLERAKLYLKKEPPSVGGAGNNTGSKQCFHVACQLVWGFALSHQEALEAIQDWNATCTDNAGQPWSWSEKELLHKFDSALNKAHHEKPRGHLLSEGRTGDAEGKGRCADNGRAEADPDEQAPEQEQEAEKGQAAEKEPRRCKATRLVQYATAELELFHSPEGDGYATTRSAPRQTWLLRSRACRLYLDRLFYLREANAAGTEVIRTAVNTLEGKARLDGPELAVACRTAEAGGVLYLDLGDRDWGAVAVKPAGWEVVAECPVRFRRSRGLLALPAPARGGSVDELRPFVNVATDADWYLLLAWLLAALRPRGPFPVLCLHGEQGSAKSTTARVIRALIDPNSAPLRSEPLNARDLIIAATNSWVVAFDNLSHIPVWLSEALCRLATGGGFSTRELYSDNEEALFDATRPCLLTGVEELASRGDLLERSLILRLPAIPEEGRRTEAEFWAAFEQARPRILGALLDAAAGGLRHLPDVRLTRLPRMADFAVWATACGPALGWEKDKFLNYYRASVADASELALDASPVTAPLRQFVEKNPEWKGTASALLGELKQLVTEEVSKDRDWPKKPHVLSGKLRRLAPDLRKSGIGIEFDREADSKRAKIIRLAELTDKSRDEASGASGASGESKDPANTGENGPSAGRSRTPPGRSPDAPGWQPGATQDAPDAPDAPPEASSEVTGQDCVPF